MIFMWIMTDSNNTFYILTTKVSILLNRSIKMQIYIYTFNLIKRKKKLQENLYKSVVTLRQLHWLVICIHQHKGGLTIDCDLIEEQHLRQTGSIHSVRVGR